MAEPEAAPRTSSAHFAPFDDLRVHYVHSGEGERTLLFVPGWACDHRFFVRQLEALAGSSLCLAVDLPGHGLSDKPRRDYDLEFLSGALGAVLDHAGVDAAVLVGHSNGAAVALDFARRDPARCLGLVSIDGTLRARYEDARVREAVTAQFRGPDYPQVVRQMFEGMLPDEMHPAERERLLEAVAATPPHVALSTMDAVNDPAGWRQGAIQAPLLVVNAKSPFWTSEDELFANELSPKVTYRVQSGVGHLLMLESPEDFHLQLNEWLDLNKL